MCRLLCASVACFSLVLVTVVRGDDYPISDPDVFEYKILDEGDDGTEVGKASWYAHGVSQSDVNYIGVLDGVLYDTGLRFDVADLNQGDSFVYARLLFSGMGYGQVETGVEARIVGIASDNVSPFRERRPSLTPKTTASTTWTIDEAWPEGAVGAKWRTPLCRQTPNIAAIINEILARPRWGQGISGKRIGLVLEGAAGDEDDFLTVEDANPAYAYDRATPRLELYRTIRSTFVAKEMLGRPTERSVTVNAMSLLTLDVAINYGLAGQPLSQSTSVVRCPGGTPFEFVLSGLQSNREYQYRLRYRRPGSLQFELGPLCSFRTKRARGSTYRFTIQSDSHIWEAIRRQGTSIPLYLQTLENIAADSPDFHIDLGDTFFCEDYSGGDVLDFEDAVHRHLAHRPFLDQVCHSSAFFSVLGNHEGEMGWEVDATPNNLTVWATNARKLVYPNPSPDSFYRGCQHELPYIGLPENYYAFEWGDALFVMLDPYHYTTRKPHSAGGTPGSGDNWDWTLGSQQYTWLRDTLQRSSATFKLVFSHQIVGGADLYGRGGVEAATHALAHPGSFEWGGQELDGRYTFSSRRPGWDMPIHQLLVENDVTIFFHGHDHCYVKQNLDGIVYQECPTPSDSIYGWGYFSYLYGTHFNNSGHLRVTVSPTKLSVEYVRSFLPGDGVNGSVATQYRIVP